MTTFSAHFDIETTGENHSVNVTEDVARVVHESGLRDGIAVVFIQATTASLIICEDENGLLADIIDAAKRFAPDAADYRHNLAWSDQNGRSHVKSSLFGQSITVPVKNSALSLGTWQSIFLFEFDLRPRKRRIVVTSIS